MTTQPSLLLKNRFEEMEKRINELEMFKKYTESKFQNIELKKDSVDNLKNSHLMFSETYNNSMLKLKTTMEKRDTVVDNNLNNLETMMTTFKDYTNSELESIKHAILELEKCVNF